MDSCSTRTLCLFSEHPITICLCDHHPLGCIAFSHRVAHHKRSRNNIRWRWITKCCSVQLRTSLFIRWSENKTRGWGGQQIKDTEWANWGKTEACPRRLWLVSRRWYKFSHCNNDRNVMISFKMFLKVFCWCWEVGWLEGIKDSLSGKSTFARDEEDTWGSNGILSKVY